MERGPCWGPQPIQDPVWTTRVTLGPKPDEDGHVLARYQFAVHLGPAMPVETYLGGKRRTRTVRFGDLSWTPVGDSCRDVWQRPREMGFVTFSCGFVSRAADELGARDALGEAIPRPGDALTGELVLALVRHDSADRVYLHTMANSLLVHLFRSAGRAKVEKSGPGSLTAKQLQRAIDYAEARLREDLDVESWARELALSPYHFARCFKRTTGLAPHQFLLRRRIERAKSILALSDAPLSSVAYDLGFANQSHFHRVFRRQTRMTPGEWRTEFGSRQTVEMVQEPG